MTYEFLNKGVATVDRIDDHAEYKDLCVSALSHNVVFLLMFLKNSLDIFESWLLFV